ncbi:MAG: NUDIX domain-containing protein [Deltaproteobacteria bacterium]
MGRPTADAVDRLGGYLPAGRVEPGESFADAAIRETLEEAGVPVVLDGVLRVEHRPSPDGTRMRVVFVAHPADDTPPKSVPDDETLGARWLTIDEMRSLPLRGDDVIALFAMVERGAPVYPMSLFGPEGLYA